MFTIKNIQISFFLSISVMELLEIANSYIIFQLVYDFLSINVCLSLCPITCKVVCLFRLTRACQACQEFMTKKFNFLRRLITLQTRM